MSKISTPSAQKDSASGCSGVFAAIWTKLGHRQPATPLKFTAGTMTMGRSAPCLP